MELFHLAWICPVLLGIPGVNSGKCEEKALAAINAAMQNYVGGTNTVINLISPQPPFTNTDFEITCKSNTLSAVKTSGTGLNLKLEGTAANTCNLDHANGIKPNYEATINNFVLEFSKDKDGVMTSQEKPLKDPPAVIKDKDGDCGLDDGDTKQLQSAVAITVQRDLQWAIGDTLRELVTPCKNPSIEKLQKELQGDKMGFKGFRYQSTAKDTQADYKLQIRLDSTAMAISMSCAAKNKPYHIRFGNGLQITLDAAYTKPVDCGGSGNVIKTATMTARLQVDYDQTNPRSETYFRIGLDAKTNDESKPCMPAFTDALYAKMAVLVKAQLDTQGQWATFDKIIKLTTGK